MDAMTTTPTSFVGCDIGKDEFVAFDTASRKGRPVANTPEAIAAFVEGLDDDVLVICEATGGYEIALLTQLVNAGKQAHRADPRKVKAFIRSFGTLGKNDDLDAGGLARYGEERHHLLPRWQLRNKDRERLSALVVLRQAVVESHTAWSNRKQAPAALADFTDPICQALAQQVKNLDAEIRVLVDSCQAIKDDVATLRNIKGIGPVTAPSLIVLMPELGSLTGKQAASLAGLAPHPNQSGTRDGYRRIKGGRPEVRRLMFMAAMTARKHNPQLKTFYERLVADGKKPLVALTAIMRKMIVIANAKIRDSRTPQVS